jgi:hypothetical protein
VPKFSFTITEHDPEKPWLVLGQEHGTATLPDVPAFFAWARERWPEPRWSIELEPWQLAPGSSVPGSGPGNPWARGAPKG